MLQAAGAVREEHTGTAITFFEELQPQFYRGDQVRVRVEDGSWRGGLRAISEIQEVEDQAGALQKVVWVSVEDEWQAAERERREPVGVPWPYEQVEFWEPGQRSSLTSENVQQAKIFISHSGADAQEVEKLANTLVSVGYKVWLDPWEIGTGHSFVERIDEGLEGATFLILGYSGGGVIAAWMSREWMATYANQLKGRGVKILPVRLTGGDPPAALGDIKYVDLANDWSKGIDELLRALR